ncbi:MAG: hypothetical protein LBF19_06215, partial [Prevotellaceae bacterium]|nr:hypothetical protein [Prevotellaceae bacterium]
MHREISLYYVNNFVENFSVAFCTVFDFYLPLQPKQNKMLNIVKKFVITFSGTPCREKELTVALCCANAFSTAQHSTTHKKSPSYSVGNLPDNKKSSSYSVGNLPDNKKSSSYSVGN